ncbi:AAA family ATPase [Pedobacter frigidisoli]|uniref:AAA family ATPase n=1 Tax=Pedobacter frigidisoli TaxID=2530455 RepID=A0A4R0NAS6_9SPHI|nr:AAA family ATPase [Pedobacter frigidisoli]TCC96717.1 AAA family ATPase [Pedobacter frigidisoli]
MNEIDLIKKIKSDYPNASQLNEAETRFKIIDEILEKYLKWPKVDTCVEFFVDGNRADYILKNKANKPILIVESKKQGVYFDLPLTFNSSKNFQKISIDKLISNENIKEAINQVKEYCEDLLCQYGAITNGDVWIIFKITPTNQKPWKKLPAFVIKNLNFFEQDYTTAINLLGYTSMVEYNSIATNIGVNKKSYTEVFFPKQQIASYDSPVNSNKYAGSLSSLSRKYLGPIPFSDKEFMRKCYVSNKGHYDELQKNVLGFLNDSLTPYFKNQGFREFTDDKAGGAFGTNIVRTIRQENLDNVMILFGGRGSGKSTFLKRFLFHVRPVEIDIHSEIALIDLIDSAQTSDTLTTEIWEKVKLGIDKDQIINSSREEILKLFSNEFEIYQKQLLVGLTPNSEDYQRLVRTFLSDNINNTKLFCEKLSLKLKSKNKGLIIFLDNMDQLNPDLQDLSYLTAIEIAKKLSCLVIISMREERFYIAKTKGALDAYHTPGYHLSAPVIPEVIIKRLAYIIEILKYTEDPDLEYGIKTGGDLNTITNFLNICIYQLKNKDSHLSRFLRFATHGDVRQALDFFRGFISSGYTNVVEISQHRFWTFQIHQVIKPMMIPDRIFYDEKLSRVPNLYRLRNDNNSSHFTGLRILNLLMQKFTSNPSGFIDSKLFVQEFEEKYYLKDDCERHLDVFMIKGIVESSNRLETYNENTDQIKITAYGHYVFDTLAFNFAYLDLVSLDCGVFNEELSNYLSKSGNTESKYKQDNNIIDRMQLRIERVEHFIEYLEEQETEEFDHFNLDATEIKFAQKMRYAFDEEKNRVIESAKRNNN